MWSNVFSDECPCGISRKEVLIAFSLLPGGLLEPPDDRWAREDLSDEEVSFVVTPLPLRDGFGLAGTGRLVSGRLPSALAR
jgi:hypothetical protein